MKKIAVVFLIGTCIFLTGNPEVSSQDLTTGTIYEKENVPYRKPVPLPHLREADIVWSKMIWRMVDLREKMNHSMYFPTSPFGSRMSLIDVLVRAIENEELIVYQDEQFQVPMNVEAVLSNLGGETEIQSVIDVDTGEAITAEIKGEIRTFEVREYLILEQWYFDKQHSRFGSRILGFCPIRVYQRTDEQGEIAEETLKRQVFWVYYPDAREVLARHEVYSRNNDLSSLSFDDLFLQRRFSGYVYRESNVYDNRTIGDYAIGREALYESQRIENMIFNFEQDLWEY